MVKVFEFSGDKKIGKTPTCSYVKIVGLKNVFEL